MSIIDMEYCSRCQENVSIRAEIEEITKVREEKKLLKRYCGECGTYLGSFEVLEIEEE